MEQVRGVNIETLNRRLGQFNRKELVDFFNERLNKTQITLAAVFDLLTAQCDRHSQVKSW